MASSKYISSVGRWLRIVLRFSVCLVIAAFLIWYIKGIVVGNLPDNHRIDAATLSVAIIGLLVIGFFVRPDLLERLTIVQALNFRLELSQVRDNLARQNDDLRTIRMVLPFLLPSAERKHLLNLKKHQTAGYFGRGVLRTELRRLRSSELIRMSSRGSRLLRNFLRAPRRSESVEAAYKTQLLIALACLFSPFAISEM